LGHGDGSHDEDVVGQFGAAALPDAGRIVYYGQFIHDTILEATAVCCENGFVNSNSLLVNFQDELLFSSSVLLINGRGTLVLKL